MSPITASTSPSLKTNESVMAISDDILTIGNRHVSLEQASRWVRRYTSAPKNPKKPHGYPWYDGYQTGSVDVLHDGDLLAPALLNVRVTIAAHASLQRLRPALDIALNSIAKDGDLAAKSADLSLLGPLFAVLEQRGGAFGVRTTLLSKVLHRKRPSFIPLYDRQVRTCYLAPYGSSPPRLPTVRGRTASEFYMAISSEIRSDLRSNLNAWRSLQDEVAGEVELSALRCFDIVAWEAGNLP
jgi:hypothetical protein